MAGKQEKVVVAMSGGVDSSVAASLLVEQGYDVMGLFMRVGASELHEAPDTPEDRGGRPHQGCCSAADAADARFVAGMLGIPFYALNFQADFDRIIDYFAAEYARGRTPNPCVVCNDRLKFGKVADYADAVGAKWIATGHYARIATRGGRRVLCRGRDERKDQSYVLFGLGPSILDRALFPIGELTKAEVRRIAADRGFPNHDKPDSVEICFVPDRDYARVVKVRRPEVFKAGAVVDEGGRVLGEHRGIAHYTIGQRRGLGIATGTPIYVTQVHADENTVVVGSYDALLAPGLLADRANFSGGVDVDVFRAEVKIRYLHRAAAATVYRLDGGRVRVVFDSPQRAVTPGQAVVFYDGDIVLGGAWIEREERESVAEIGAVRSDDPRCEPVEDMLTQA